MRKAKARLGLQQVAAPEQTNLTSLLIVKCVARKANQSWPLLAHDDRIVWNSNTHFSTFPHLCVCLVLKDYTRPSSCNGEKNTRKTTKTELTFINHMWKSHALFSKFGSLLPMPAKWTCKALQHNCIALHCTALHCQEKWSSDIFVWSRWV